MHRQQSMHQVPLTLVAASPQLATADSPWEWTWSSNRAFSSVSPSGIRDTSMYILARSERYDHNLTPSAPNYV